MSGPVIMEMPKILGASLFIPSKKRYDSSVYQVNVGEGNGPGQSDLTNNFHDVYSVDAVNKVDVLII